MNTFLSTIVAIAVVLISTVYAKNICNNPCEGREAGHMVADCVPCPGYLECTGNGPNDYVPKTCSDPKACLKEVIQKCAQTCDQPNPPDDCYSDAVLAGGPALGGAPPLNLPVSICNNPCEGREAGHMVGDCVPCPDYLVCTGNGPNDYLPMTCPDSQACLKEVIQKCARSCFPIMSDGCFDDAVLGGGPPISDDTVDRMILPQSAGALCPTGAAGIRSCHGKKDGNYQSCVSCNHFVSCTAGRMVGGQRPCPDKIVWDDNVKKCEWTSNTCTQP